jgi:hypothetical protein
VLRDFIASGFFHESSSPKPLKITLSSFLILSKIRGDIRKSRCTIGINSPVANLPPVSTTPAANLSKYSLYYPKVYKHNIYKTFLIEDLFPFATGVNDTGGAP